MIMKPIDEIYPTWDGENEDREVNNLIVDILEDKFVKGYWDVKQIEVSKKKLKGKNVEVSEHPNKKEKRKNVELSEHPKKKDKRKKRSSGDEEELDEEGPVKKKKADDSMKISRVEGEDYETGVSVTSLLQLVEKMYTRFDLMEQNISGIVGGIEGKLEAKFDEKYGHRITSVEDKVGVLENEIKWMKERIGPREMENSILNDGNSKVFQEQELKPYPTNVAEIDDKVLLKEVYKRKLVAKKLVKEDKKLVKEGNKLVQEGNEEKKKDNVQKEGIDLAEKVIVDKKVKEEKKTNKYDNKQNKKTEQASKKDTSDVFDITDQVAQEENKLLDESEENEEEKLRQAKVDIALDLLQKGLEGLENPQKKKFPPPPPYPMIGESGMTFMRKGLVPSPAIYDPLKPVNKIKMEKLREFLRPYEHIPLTEKLVEDVQFYRDLITPRKDWPRADYGWLADYHMASFLRLLRKRSMNVTSPFYTDRIDFIDQWFVSMWVKDYEQFNLNPKKWKFSKAYVDLANGKSPNDMPTHKKWIYDVDVVYLVHQVSGCHWITLEIDLANEKIDCYDSIMGEGTAEQDKNIHEKCRVFTRMIPALLNEVIPPTIRKVSNQQFKFRRRKGVPQNETPGDCGVYSLKYIEMLALGVVFEGLSDRNIQAIREKMAAEIFDEVPDMFAQFM